MFLLLDSSFRFLTISVGMIHVTRKCCCSAEFPAFTTVSICDARKTETMNLGVAPKIQLSPQRTLATTTTVAARNARNSTKVITPILAQKIPVVARDLVQLRKPNLLENPGSIASSLYAAMEDRFNLPSRQCSTEEATICSQ